VLVAIKELVVDKFKIVQFVSGGVMIRHGQMTLKKARSYIAELEKKWVKWEAAGFPQDIDPGVQYLEGSDFAAFNESDEIVETFDQ
jgi:uncharacterized membrane protein